VSHIVRLRPDEIYSSRELSIVSHVHTVSLTQRQRGAPRPKDLTEAGMRSRERPAVPRWSGRCLNGPGRFVGASSGWVALSVSRS
jgi:hypothetical protein